MHRLRVVRVGLPGRLHLRGGRRQHRGGAVLPRGTVRARLPDQLPALHPVRAVHRSVPHPRADHDQRVRERRRQPGKPDLDQGAAGRAAAAGHGGAAAPEAARRDRAGLLPARHLRGGGQPPGGRGGPSRDGRPMSHSMVLASGMAAETQNLTFWILAVVSVAAALAMVLAPRAVHCAVLLAIVMLSLAVLYALLGAPFLAFVQVIVYTGAVLMLFLFVLMIVGVSSRDSLVETIRGQRLAAGLVGIGLLVLLSLTVGHAAIGPASPVGPSYSATNVNGLAKLIFTTYVYPFEITAALLITAALGAMVLAHRERTSPRLSQRVRARKRISGTHPTPLPGPGTYARHNAVDMPALLPDGTPAKLSVSEVITGPSPDEQDIPALASSN